MLSPMHFKLIEIIIRLPQLELKVLQKNMNEIFIIQKLTKKIVFPLRTTQLFYYCFNKKNTNLDFDINKCVMHCVISTQLI